MLSAIDKQSPYFLPSYANWAEQHPLMDAQQEREKLLLHEKLYRQLFLLLCLEHERWLKKQYKDLDLSNEHWQETLWEKRPYSRHLISLVKKSRQNRDKVENTMQRWLEVRDFILASNIRLVLKLAHKHSNENFSLLELVQEGQFGMVRALERFDCSRELRFSTFATPWIIQFIRLAIKKTGRLVYVPNNVQDQVLRTKQLILKSQQQAGRSVKTFELAKKMDLSTQEINELISYGMPTFSLNEPIGDDSQDIFQDGVESNAPTPEQKLEQQRTRKHIQQLLKAVTPRQAMVLKMRYGINMPRTYGYQEIATQLNLSRERVRQIENETLKKLADQAPA